MRSMLQNQRFNRSLEKKRSVPQIGDVFTRPIIEQVKEVNEEPSSDISVNVLESNPIPGELIVPIVEGQELDNWEAKDIPFLFFEYCIFCY